MKKEGGQNAFAFCHTLFVWGAVDRSDRVNITQWCGWESVSAYRLSQLTWAA